MASLFSADHPENVLDAGAGIGSLSAAVLNRFPQSKIEAWEIDPVLGEYLERSLSGADLTIHRDDFIEGAVNRIQFLAEPRFSHAILNPPYRKIQTRSRHRSLLRQVGIETVNLYTGFVALAVLMLRQGGELVAIIPRSFCNGPYYRPFRELLLTHCSIENIHIFESRKKAFQDDDVLQENVIIKLVRGKQRANVCISRSEDALFTDFTNTSFPFKEIVKPSDPELFIHIPSKTKSEIVGSIFRSSLKEVGLAVSTGPVVDFRLKDDCREQLADGMAPLIYAHHFVNGQLQYPVSHKKPGAIQINTSTKKWLMKSGHYVITRRFSSKEEQKRIVAYVFEPDKIGAELIGFENHLNVYHSGKQGMDRVLSYGLATFLNATLVDNCFREFSGHTQVNATDLKNMKYPSIGQMISLGTAALDIIENNSRWLTQAEIDSLVGMVAANGN